MSAKNLTVSDGQRAGTSRPSTRARCQCRWPAPGKHRSAPGVRHSPSGSPRACAGVGAVGSAQVPESRAVGSAQAPGSRAGRPTPFAAPPQSGWGAWLGEGSFRAGVSPRWFPRRAAGHWIWPVKGLAWTAAGGQPEAFRFATPLAREVGRPRLPRVQAGPRAGLVFAMVGEWGEPKAGRLAASAEFEARAAPLPASAKPKERTGESLVSAKAGGQAESRLASAKAGGQAGILARRLWPGPAWAAWTGTMALPCLARWDARPVAERGLAPEGRLGSGASHALSFLAAKATRMSRRLA